MVAVQKKKMIALIAAGGLALVVLATMLVVSQVRANATRKDANAAAAKYDKQNNAWEAAFGSDALSPILQANPNAFGNAYKKVRKGSHYDDWKGFVPKAKALAKVCAGVDDIAGSVGSMDKSIPEEPSVEGGDDVAAYREARAAWNRNKASYEASSAFLTEAKASLPQIQKSCDYVLAENVADRAMAKASTAYSKFVTLPSGGRELARTVAHSSTSGVHIYLLCNEESGCVSYTDMKKRKAAAKARANFYQARHQGMIQVLKSDCPAPLAEVCATRITMEQAALKAGKKVAATMRTENPMDRVFSDRDVTDVLPRFHKAEFAYWKTTNEKAWKPVEKALKATFDTGDMDEALTKIVHDATVRIQTAAKAIQPTAN